MFGSLTDNLVLVIKQRSSSLIVFMLLQFKIHSWKSYIFEVFIVKSLKFVNICI